jgi:uncharacterized protein YjbI with pentapeptide repeats
MRGAEMRGAGFVPRHLHRRPAVGHREQRRQLPGRRPVRVDLSSSELHGASFQGANLERANLSSSELIGANMQGVNARGANFSSPS